MGQTHSRVGDDSQIEERIESGVRVTIDLLNQLSGQPRSKSSDAAGRSIRDTVGQPEEESLVVLRRDPKLQEALRHSRRVGDMLLKVEEQEMAKVNQLTDDLLKKEYRAPLRETPCLQEREACLQCYKNNSQDVLKCADAVAAYAACAQQAVAMASS
ncbi:g1947 [Coccomyxa elongata]